MLNKLKIEIFCYLVTTCREIPNRGSWLNCSKMYSPIKPFIHQRDGTFENLHLYLYFKGTTRGLKALQSYMNGSYHKNVLYQPEPTINPWTSRVQQPSHNMLRGQWGGITYDRNQPLRPLDVPLMHTQISADFKQAYTFLKSCLTIRKTCM